jgi:predicted amino acid-binding ACT domain protein
MFDDQHQPMSDWLSKLASDESKNFTDADLKEESVPEVKEKTAHKGISTTWDKSRPDIIHEAASDAVRHIKNRPEVLASSEQIEKEARKLIMSGVNIEKVETILNRRYSKDEMAKFASVILPNLESDYGKLGYIYLDASLVDDCGDLSTMMKNSHKVASIAIKNVKHIAKCDDCSMNHRCHCVKLGLNIVDSPEVKTAAEAKSIINKFASLKYINSYFVKTSELSSYYNRLAKDESPSKVVQDFLVDLGNRRTAKQTVNNRVLVNESAPAKIANKEHIIKVGMSDIEVGNAFKQFLVMNPSLKTAKAELMKRYGSERIEGYIQEARRELKHFVRFIEAKVHENKARVSSAVETSTNGFMNKESAAKIASAEKMAYSLLTFCQPTADVARTIIRTFGKDAAAQVMSKIASDKEARFLGVTYLDSGLYHNAAELKQVYDALSKRANNMIFQVKDNDTYKLAQDENGRCAATGLKIVKNAEVDSKRQALRVLNHVKKANIINQFDHDRMVTKLAETGNANIMKSFLVGISTNKKAISAGIVKQVSDVALKYAKNIPDIRKIACTNWTSIKTLVETLDSHVINKNAFHDEVHKIVDKSAPEANIYLKQANQYDVEIFSPDKDKVSDVILGQMM